MREELCEEARSIVSSARRSYVRTRSSFELFAAKWLLANEYTPLQTDKDGGFCLIRNNLVLEMFHSKLIAPMYIPTFSWNIRPHEMLSSMSRKLKVLESALKIEGLAKHLNQGMYSCSDTKFVSRILATVKTHKDAGEVSLRLLHSGVGHPFGGVSKLLAKLLRPKLADVLSICKSTDDVIGLLKSCVIPFDEHSHVKICKLDVKDFYMCGSPTQLCEDSFDHCCDEVRHACESILFEILSSQFVSLNYDIEEFYKVEQGSGMGQVLSGDIAEAKFHSLCERSHACNTQTMHAHSVWLYARYRDDILIVYTTKYVSPSPFEFVAKLKSLAAPVYKVNLDVVSSDRVPFLDIEIYKSIDFLQTGILKFRPFCKPSAQKIPLNQCSCHNSHIHESWPIANISRLFNRSSTWRDFCVARSLVIADYEKFFMDSDVIARLKSWTPYKPKSERKSREVAWVVLPYHPLLVRLNSRLKAVSRNWAGANFVMPALSWSRAFANLQDEVTATYFSGDKRSGGKR